MTADKQRRRARTASTRETVPTFRAADRLLDKAQFLLLELPQEGEQEAADRPLPVAVEAMLEPRAWTGMRVCSCSCVRPNGVREKAVLLSLGRRRRAKARSRQWQDEGRRRVGLEEGEGRQDTKGGLVVPGGRVCQRARRDHLLPMLMLEQYWR